MAAILVSFGFTFLIDRMTEVLTPDIYIELTGIGIGIGRDLFSRQLKYSRFFLIIETLFLNASSTKPHKNKYNFYNF
jgi:hypothetical protein